MELIVLGSGTYQPELERHSSSYLVRTGGQNLVFDFGRGTLDGLLKQGLNYADLESIFITHAHADHASELSSFLHIACAEPEINRLRKKETTIYGPLGFKKVIRHLLSAWGLENCHPIPPITVLEIKENQTVDGSGWRIKTYATEYCSPKKSLAYRLEAEGKILTYSGDSTDCPGLRKACEGADLAVLEASWPEKLNPKTHLTAPRAAKIAAETGVKKLILTHIAPYYFKTGDPKKDAEQFFKGAILLAQDLLTVEV